MAKRRAARGVQHPRTTSAVVSADIVVAKTVHRSGHADGRAVGVSGLVDWNRRCVAYCHIPRLFFLAAAARRQSSVVCIAIGGQQVDRRGFDRQRILCRKATVCGFYRDLGAARRKRCDNTVDHAGHGRCGARPRHRLVARVCGFHGRRQRGLPADGQFAGGSVERYARNGHGLDAGEDLAVIARAVTVAVELLLAWIDDVDDKRRVLGAVGRLVVGGRFAELDAIVFCLVILPILVITGKAHIGDSDSICLIFCAYAVCNIVQLCRLETVNMTMKRTEEFSGVATVEIDGIAACYSDTRALNICVDNVRRHENISPIKRMV